MRLRQTICLIFFLVSLEAIVGVPKLGWDLAVKRTGVLGAGFALMAATVALLVAWHGRLWIDARIKALTQFCARIPATRWLLLCVLTGVALRFLWVWLFPAPRRSDYATYFELARSLALRHSYLISNTGYAYWPPGYPLFLSAFFSLFGVRDWIPFLANMFLFTGTIAVAYRLALSIGGVESARLTTLLLVIWPAFLTSAGLASKELLALFLLPAGFLAFAAARDRTQDKIHLHWLAVSGTLLGFAGLTQPSLLLFPGILFVYDWLQNRHWIGSCSRVAGVLGVMVLVMLPWTFRNHRMLGQWVPVSTNGGDVFFRANNDVATGGYIPLSDPRLANLDEIRRNRLGFQLGEQWIWAHPAAFFRLALRKQTLFLGDDAQGVYETLKRGLGIGDYRYFLLKGLSSLFWWIVWISILVHMGPLRRRISVQPEICALMLSVLYLFIIHSIFESGGKYHVPLLVFIAMLASFANTESRVMPADETCEAVSVEIALSK